MAMFVADVAEYSRTESARTFHRQPAGAATVSCIEQIDEVGDDRAGRLGG